MVNQSFLESTRNQRYEKGISLEEKTSVPIRDHRARDMFSLGVLSLNIDFQSIYVAKTKCWPLWPSSTIKAK